MSDKRVSFDLFQQGSAPRGLWEEIATSLNAAAMHGGEIVQLHMGAVVQRVRLLVFRSVGPESTGAEPTYGWGATLILATRVAENVYEEIPLNHFVADDEAANAQMAVETWVKQIAVDHFCQVATVEGWQTQWFSHDVLRGTRTEPANQRLAKRIVAATDERLAALRTAATEGAVERRDGV